MTFASLTGGFADAFFRGVGCRNHQIRFDDLVLSPVPLVSDDKVQSHSEFSSPLSDAEGLLTVTVSITIAQFKNQLAAAISSGTETLDTELGLGNITPAEYAEQLAALQAKYAWSRVISPKQPWAVSYDGCKTWRNMRSLSIDQAGEVRITMILVSRGIPNG